MEHMSHINGPQADTTESTEPKPPTIAEIVREKTDNGRLIIDFFTDVMRGKIEGAQLCHRMDAAKELVKFGSAEAVIFIAKYKGIPCGHSTRGRRDSADTCIAEERSLVEVTLNAPASLTREFLTVLSGIDEFLMRRLIRAQTVDGGTIIEFLDDVMQDRNEGFKTHHRIAAAKELIVHIIRDEQPSHTPSPKPVVGADPRVRPLPGSQTPSPSTGEGWSEGDSPTPSPLTGEGRGEGDSPTLSPSTGEGDTPAVGADPRVRPLPGSKTPAPSTGEGDTPAVGADPRVRPLPGSKTPAPSTGEGGACPESPRRSDGDSIVVPDKSEPATYSIRGTHPLPEQPGADTLSAHPEPAEEPVLGNVEGPAEGACPEPVERAQGPQDHKVRRTGKRRTRTQRRRDGNARAATRRKALGSERIEEKDEKPAPAELTIAERRINEKLEQHWHEPDPYGAPIDSTHPGRSPPS